MGNRIHQMDLDFREIEERRNEVIDDVVSKLPNKLWLNINEVKKFTGLSRNRIYEMAETGRFVNKPKTAINNPKRRHRVYATSSIRQYLQDEGNEA